MLRMISLFSFSFALSGLALAEDSAEPSPDSTQAESSEVTEDVAEDRRSRRRQARRESAEEGAANQRPERPRAISDEQLERRHAERTTRSHTRETQEHRRSNDGRSGQDRSEERQRSGNRQHRSSSSHQQSQQSHRSHRSHQSHRNHSSSSSSSHRQARANYRSARNRLGNHRTFRHFRPYRSGPVYWYHGTVVYGPYPQHHSRIRRGGGTDSVAMPNRSIDRNGDFSVGLRSGTYLSGYEAGGDFSDFGLGVAARFRPVESLGFEVAYSYHDDTFDGESERATGVLQPSLQVFLLPWTRFSPYATMGLTWTERSYNDTWSDGLNEYNTQVEDSTFGPHVGLGLELALGENASIDFETRAIGYLSTQDADTLPGAVQATFGGNFYF